MTSLAAAISLDSRGPSGLYIITDSRISWPKNGHWDAGRKTFASRSSADIFGYCGDAYFVPTVLGQATDLFEQGVMPIAKADAEARHNALVNLLRASIQRGSPPFSSFSVFHGAREGELMESQFKLWRTSYDPRTRVWLDERLQLSSSHSYLAHIDGSGQATVDRYMKAIDGGEAAGTSRAAVHAFCRALHSGADVYSGGPPQLVGIWRKFTGQHFGFCWHGKSYLSGLEVPVDADHSAVNWFNHLFERVDGRTGSKLPEAKSHRATLAPRRLPKR
jgi:hypothetical protein